MDPALRRGVSLGDYPLETLFEILLKTVDLAIIGGGSAGFAAAKEALTHHASIAMFEGDVIGGTCPNRGCVPSKYLLHEAFLYAHEQPHPSRSSTAEWQRHTAGLSRRVQESRAARHDFLRTHRQKLHYFSQTARFLSSQTLKVGETVVHARRIVITTGSEPWVPPVPGLLEIPYLTSDSVFQMKQLPRSMIVMGAGPLGLELGQMLARFGVHVTLLSDQPRLLPDEEPEAAAVLRKALEAQGIQIFERTSVVKAAASRHLVSLHVRRGTRVRVLRAEQVLVATGRRARSAGMGLLENTRVKLDKRGGIIVRADLQTSDPAIWAAGDCVSCECPNQYVYVAKRQGTLAARNALKGRSTVPIDYRVVPRVTFTSPEFASVGMTEASAKRRGLRVVAKSLPLDYVPRAWIHGESTGVIKLVARADTKVLLGATIVSPRAGETIHEAALAIEQRLPVSIFQKLFHAYPTYAEALPLCAALFE